jgi:hypothetical protein
MMWNGRRKRIEGGRKYGKKEGKKEGGGDGCLWGRRRGVIKEKD